MTYTIRNTYTGDTRTVEANSHLDACWQAARLSALTRCEHKVVEPEPKAPAIAEPYEVAP